MPCGLGPMARSEEQANLPGRRKSLHHGALMIDFAEPSRPSIAGTEQRPLTRFKNRENMATGLSLMRKRTEGSRRDL